jgi:hypothetical protein
VIAGQHTVHVASRDLEIEAGRFAPRDDLVDHAYRSHEDGRPSTTLS